MSLDEFVKKNQEFKEIYDFVEINLDVVNEIKKIPKTYFLRIFASSTCQFCKIYIPQLLKIHELVNFSLEFIIWENFTDDQLFSISDDYELTGLPTFIFFSNNNVELGRIVKEPVSSIENDILRILNLN
jgi:thiol-disulfide isomerase/thioredoxin